MKQENQTALEYGQPQLEKDGDGWTFRQGTIRINDIREELFNAHCERFRESIARDIPQSWDEWRKLLFQERVSIFFRFWRRQAVPFLEDCAHFPYCEENVPPPKLLPDGVCDLLPVHEYLRQWRKAVEKRHYPLPTQSLLKNDRDTVIMARYWGYRECDCYYRGTFDFMTETIDKPLGKGENYPTCSLYVGQAPNGKWAIASRLHYDNGGRSIWCRYQFPSRHSAILHETDYLRMLTADGKEIRNKKDILEWLDSLDESLIQPELFAFAG